jgi:glycosyltransferase involved in cell wall biosynthesis
MTRIAYSGTFWGQEATGSGQYLHHLLAALHDAAPEIDERLVLPRFQSASDMPPEPSALSVATPLDGHSENLAKLWFEQCAFPRACRQLNADLAHVPYFAPPLFPGVPTVVTIHDLIPLVLPEYGGSFAVRSYMRLVSAGARRAAMVLTDSQASANDIQRLLHIPAERLRVTYLAADAAYRPVLPEGREPVLQRLGITGRYLLYLGGFDCRKNVIGLLHAFAACRQALGDVSLVIGGRLPAADSPFAPDPRPVARALHLGSSVSFAGWVDEQDKPALYSGALALAFPSYYEGFGLPVLEALSCGTPAIIGAGSSLEEVAGPGGLAVKPGDNRALADALTRIVRNETLRLELADRGRRHAAGFSWARTAEQTLAAYRQVLQAER